MLGVFALLVVATLVLYQRLPTSFLPEEDQGYFIVSVQLPDGSSLQRTESVTQEVVEKMLAIPGVASTVVQGGNDFLTGAAASNAASCYVILSPWDERKSADVQLACDVCRVLYRRPDIDAIVIVSGDRDFIPIARQVLEENRELRVVAIPDSTSGDLRMRVGGERFWNALDLIGPNGRDDHTASAEPARSAEAP